MKKTTRTISFSWVNVFINIVYFLSHLFSQTDRNPQLNNGLTVFEIRHRNIFQALQGQELCQSSSPLYHPPLGT